MNRLIALLQTLLARTPGAETFADAFSGIAGHHPEPPGNAAAIAFADGTGWADNGTPETQAIAQMVRDAAFLDWAVPYGDDPRAGRGFAQRSAFCTVAGPGASIHTTSLAAGFFLVGADVDYNDHRHGPVELYLPLSGTARYWSEPTGWHRSPPGRAIVHDAWAWHSLQTGDQPVLIFWMWHLTDGQFGPMPELAARLGGLPVGEPGTHG